MNGGPSDIRELELEQFVLGELPAARAAEIESRVSEPMWQRGLPRSGNPIGRSSANIRPA